MALKDYLEGVTKRNMRSPTEQMMGLEAPEASADLPEEDIFEEPEPQFKLQAKAPMAAIQAGARGDGNYLADNSYANSGLPVLPGKSGPRVRSLPDMTDVRQAWQKRVRDEAAGGLADMSRYHNAGLRSQANETLNKMLGIGPQPVPEGLVEVDKGSGFYTTPESADTIRRRRGDDFMDQQGVAEGELYSQADLAGLSPRDRMIAESINRTGVRSGGGLPDGKSSMKIGDETIEWEGKLSEQSEEIRQKVFIGNLEKARGLQTENLTPQELTERGPEAQDKAVKLKAFSEMVLTKLGDSRLDDMTKEELDLMNEAGRLHLSGEEESAEEKINQVMIGRINEREKDAYGLRDDEREVAINESKTKVSQSRVNGFMAALNEAIISKDFETIASMEGAAEMLASSKNWLNSVNSPQERSLLASNANAAASAFQKVIQQDQKALADPDNPLSDADRAQANKRIKDNTAAMNGYLKLASDAAKAVKPSETIKAKKETEKAAKEGLNPDPAADEGGEEASAKSDLPEKKDDLASMKTQLAEYQKQLRKIDPGKRHTSDIAKKSKALRKKIAKLTIQRAPSAPNPRKYGMPGL